MSWILRTKGVESGRCYCQIAHHGTWPYITFIKFRLIWSATIFWSVNELLIGELYNQGRCDRHGRQLYGSVAGNSGDIFFPTCFRQFMIFCAKFYFSAQMATMSIGNTNPALKHKNNSITRMKQSTKGRTRTGHNTVWYEQQHMKDLCFPTQQAPSQGEQILSFKNKLLFRREVK